MSLERSPVLRHLCLGEFQRFKPGLVGQQWGKGQFFQPQELSHICAGVCAHLPAGVWTGARWFYSSFSRNGVAVFFSESNCERSVKLTCFP